MNLTSGMWRRFKTQETDENRIISKLVRGLLPEEVSLVVDVGAGYGDIALEAFPNIDALLIDVADFPSNGCPNHRRITQDFFDVECNGAGGGLMLFSHVLQYLDDDVDRLVGKTFEFRPEYVLVVCNVIDQFQRDCFDWFDRHRIRINPETPIEGFPGEGFEVKKRIQFTGTTRVSSFADLGDRLSRLIFDASISTMQTRDFGRWLNGKLVTPEVSIPQTVELYQRVPDGDRNE